ncbi:hypothetical protein ACQI4L_11275 [Mycolicibacterium litorale]|uniref:hypothetical protein n=1 Tax=Mycolicibacterium litorale TaxID=758802 RepID=UPI003CE9A1B2
MAANPSIASASSLSATADLERRQWKARLTAGAVVGLVLGALLGGLGFGSLSSDSTATAFIRITQPVDFSAVAGGASQTTPDSQDVVENYVAGEVAYLSGEGFAQAVGRKLAKSEPADIIVSQAGGSSVVTISNSSSSADEARRTVQAAIDIYGQQLAQRVDQQMRSILPTLDRWQLANTADGQRMAEISALREGIMLQGAQASAVTVLQPPTVTEPGVSRWLIGALLGGVVGAALVVLVVMRRSRRRQGLVPQVSETVDRVLTPAVNLRTSRNADRASLARGLYAQCVAAAPDKRIVLLGVSEGSGSAVIASLFEFAAAERGPVTRVDAADGVASAEAFADSTAPLIVDAGAVGASAFSHQAIGAATAVVLVARIDHDGTARAVAACSAAESSSAPLLAVFTYQPWWATWWTGIRGRSPGARTP